jgi:hypothetical protein
MTTGRTGPAASAGGSELDSAFAVHEAAGSGDEWVMRYGVRLRFGFRWGS